MSRGKYASRSEALTARESAIRNLSCAQRENERLNRENAVLKKTLAEEQEYLGSEVNRLRALVDSQTSEREVVLKEQIETLTSERDNARKDISAEIARIYRRAGAPIPADAPGVEALIKALGVTPAEFFIGEWPNNRKDRRTQTKDIGKNWEENTGWGTRNTKAAPGLNKVVGS